MTQPNDKPNAEGLTIKAAINLAHILTYEYGQLYDVYASKTEPTTYSVFTVAAGMRYREREGTELPINWLHGEFVGSVLRNAVVEG